MLEELTEKEFQEFSKTSPSRNFMETIEIGNLRKSNEWIVNYLGLKKDKKIVGATLLLSKKRHFNKYEFYALRGPLLDYNDKKLVSTFLSELKKYVKKHNGYCLRLDPYLPFRRFDGKGNELSLTYNPDFTIDLLNSLGFKKADQEEQVSSMYVLNLVDKSENDILKEMKANTRNCIRKTIKNGIEVVELKKDELQEFYDVMIETGKRKGFDIRDISYYENMYDLFSKNGEIKYLVTRLNLDKYVELLENEIMENETKKQKLSASSCNDGKRKEFETTIESLKKRINIAKEQKKEANKSVITLAGSMFVMTRPEIVYLSSGNYEKYMMYNSQYLIQWEMIKYAIDNSYERYNFYGTPITSKKDKSYGIYEFKAGFNGFMEQLIGEYVVATSPVYYLINLIHKIKKS